MNNNRGKLEQSIVAHVFKNSNLLTKIGNRLAGEHELTQQQWVLLEALRKNADKGIQFSHLGKNLLVTKSNITGIISRLESAGFVTRERNNEDRRVLKAKITKKGIAHLDKIKSAEEKWNKLCFGCFSQKEKENYHKFLQKHFDFLYKDIYGR